MQKVKVATLKQSPYGFVGNERVDPTRLGVEAAIEERRFSVSVMDKDYNDVRDNILKTTNDDAERNRLMREFHNERVAELVRTKEVWLGLQDQWPIKINQFNQIVEGNHRFRAVRFLKIDEIEVAVVTESISRQGFMLPEIW